MTDDSKPRETNMDIWRQLETTPSSATKAVSFGGRRFKSIDPQWQLQRMTECFGPIGKSWGYETEADEVQCGHITLARVQVVVWLRVDDDEHRWGPVTGCCELALPRLGDDKRPIYDDQLNPVLRVDTDAYKKAETDALTKALSRLGMSADVFLGRHDDSKYTQFVSDLEKGGAVAAERLKTAARAATSGRQRSQIKAMANQALMNQDIAEEAYQAIIDLVEDAGADHV